MLATGTLLGMPADLYLAWAWLWGGAGVAASVAGAVAGTWWGGWLWGAAGALVGLPAAVPLALKVRTAENHLYTDWQMRGYAKAAAEG